MPKRTIRHKVVTFTDADKNNQVATRGQTVDIPAKEIERLEPLGAFTPEDETGEPPAPPTGSQVDAVTGDSTDAELSAFVANATVDEVSDTLAKNPDLAERVLAAETDIARLNNVAPRKGVVSAVEVAVKNRTA